MCGIFGFVRTTADPSSVVIEGLKDLEYRGYDSWGVAVVDRRSRPRREGRSGRSDQRLLAASVKIQLSATPGGRPTAESLMRTPIRIPTVMAGWR